MKADDPDIFASETFTELYEKFQFQPRIAEVPRTTVAPEHGECLSDLPTIFPFQVKTDRSRVLELLGASGIRLNVLIGEYGRPHDPFSRQFEEVEISEFIDCHLLDPGYNPFRPYAANFRLTEALLREIVDYPNFFAHEDLHEGVCWLGGNGCVTPLHKDGSDNFSFQIFGTKRWTIFPIRDAPKLRLKRVLQGREYAASEINILHEELEIPKLTFTVGAGECLFLPRGWSHCVETTSPTFMVNYWRVQGSLPPLQPSALQ